MLCNAFTACPKTASNPWAPYWNTREIHRLEVRATPAFPRSQSYLRQHFSLRGCSWNTDLRHWCRLLLRYHWGLLRHSGEAGLGSNHSDLRQSRGRGVTYHPGGRCLGPRLCLWTLGCGNQRPKLWHGRGWYQKNTIEKIKARSVQMQNITEKELGILIRDIWDRRGAYLWLGFAGSDPALDTVLLTTDTGGGEIGVAGNAGAVGVTGVTGVGGMLESLRLSWLGSDALLGSAFTELSLLLDFYKETKPNMKAFTKTGCDCCSLRPLNGSIQLQMMPWCKILKSQTSDGLPSSPAATHGLVSVAALVLREKGNSAVINIQKIQISTLVNLPAATVLEVSHINIKKIKERHPNPDSFSTARGRAADMLHMLCYRLTSKLDLKRLSLRWGTQMNSVDLCSLKINMDYSQSWETQSSLSPTSFCALVVDSHIHQHNELLTQKAIKQVVIFFYPPCWIQNLQIKINPYLIPNHKSICAKKFTILAGGFGFCWRAFLAFAAAAWAWWIRSANTNYWLRILNTSKLNYQSGHPKLSSSEKKLNTHAHRDL